MGQTAGRRPIGQLLRDGGFLSQSQLEEALQEQQHSRELLGQLLIRTGVLKGGELRVVQAVQERLSDLEQATGLGAGERQLLGTLLVRAGRLSHKELGRVLEEQQSAGGRLGETCLRLGLLTGPELEAVLAFQHHQGPDRRHATPLRLGELLVSLGQITREELVNALRKQAGSRSRLGEVLVVEGYAQQCHVRHGMRVQQLLTNSVLATILSLAALSGDGRGRDIYQIANVSARG